MAPARFSEPYILVEDGPGVGQRLVIPQGVSVIGRVSTADLRLQHPSISRQHAQLVRKGERIFVKDLGSQNGTFVNRERLNGETEVRAGDEIALGNAVLRLLQEPSLSPGPAPSGATMPETPSKAPSASASGRISVPPSSRAAASGGVVSAAHKPASTVSLGKAALITGGLGFGVAAVVLVGVLLFSSSRGTVPPVSEQAEEPLEAEIELEQDPVVRPMFANEEENQKVKRAMAEAMRDSLADPASPTMEGAQAISTGRNVVVNRANERARIIRRYEEGKLVSALDLARASPQSELYETLTGFQGAYEEARAAQRARQPSVAIRNYETALKFDRELTNGNSFFASEIKSELADLMVQVAQSQKKKRDLTGARKTLSLALKYQPAHAEAKSLMSALTPGPPAAAKKAVRKKARSRSSSIDDAFDEDEEAGFDEEEPAPKPRKKAPSRSAIDDAFEE